MQIPETLSVNGKSYRILSLLGKGKGGYSYLAEGQTGERYVVKQIHHEPCDYYQFGDKLQSELRDYQRLQQVGVPIPVLLDADAAQERILKEYIHGPTIAQLVEQNQMKQEYYEQIRQICDLCYPAGINIDYYPTNFVVQDDRLYYIDFECNPYSPQWDYEHWGRQYWGPQAP